jgi:hypothetical protein
MRVMRALRWGWIGVSAAAVLVAGWLVSGRGAAVAADESAVRRPVLVELFTSEGCSSCPPADALLARLDAAQFVPGAQAIVLSEHVTYWDHDGWRDPFSLDAVTERQRQYSGRLGLDEVYTPQAVVDGAAQLVGSDARRLSAAVQQAAALPKAELAIQDAQWSGNVVMFSVKGAADGRSVLMAALAEDSAQTAVKSGENAGRNLHHVAVVRVLEEMGKGADDGRALTLKTPSGNQSGPLRLVVFLADRHNGHVLAVAERTISRS